MLPVFIDTNVFLRFYAYSDDTLNEVEKLAALVQAGEIKLLATQQVIEEWARNRDKELEESFKRLGQIGASSPIPRFAAHLTQASQLSDLLKQVKASKSDLIAAINSELDGDGLRADKVISHLFQLSGVLERTESAISKARLRQELANPPGKSGSLGDQINWEILLSGVAAGTDLHIVSRDGDFKSVAFEGKPNFFLREEWKREKNSELHLYSGLAEFTKAHFPNLKLPSDVLKGHSIKNLTASTSYHQTHAAVSELAPMINELSSEEAVSLFVALTTNSQISDIISDADVKSFFSDLWDRFFLDTSKEMDSKLEEISGDIFGLPF